MAPREAPPCTSHVAAGLGITLGRWSRLGGGDGDLWRLNLSLGPTHIKIGSITSRAASRALCLVALAHSQSEHTAQGS